MVHHAPQQFWRVNVELLPDHTEASSSCSASQRDESVSEHPNLLDKCFVSFVGLEGWIVDDQLSVLVHLALVTEMVLLPVALDRRSYGTCNAATKHDFSEQLASSLVAPTAPSLARHALFAGRRRANTEIYLSRYLRMKCMIFLVSTGRYDRSGWETGRTPGGRRSWCTKTYTTRKLRLTI